MRTRKLFILLFVLTLLKTFSFAQTQEEAYALFNQGNEYFDANNYADAILYYKRAIPAYEKIYGKNHLYTGNVYFFLGLSYNKTRDYQNALPWLKKSFDVYNAPNGNKGWAADALNYIASTYYHMSEYDVAISFYQQELSLRKLTVGENSKETATCYTNIGLQFEFKGEYNTALSYYETALAIRKKIFGENDLRTADSYHDIAAENYFLGNYQTALDNYLKALKIREDITGPNSYETAHTLSAMTTLYIDCQMYDEALKTSELTEQIYSELINPISSTFGILYNERGRIHFGLGDYKKALDFYNKSLDIYLQVYGEKNVYTAKAYSNIGDIYQAMGDYPRALANLEKALAIDKAIFGDSNPEIAFCYRTIGAIYRSIGNFDLALSYFIKASEIYQKSVGEKHFQVALCYEEIGSIYSNKKEYQKALEYYYKGEDIIYEVFGYETKDSARILKGISIIDDYLGYHEEAESLLKKFIKIFTQFTGSNSSETAISYSILGWHYAEQKQSKLAVESFRKSYAGFKNSTNYNQVLTNLSLILRDSKKFNYDTDTAFIRETISIATDIVERARLDMTSMKSDLLRQSLPIYYYGVDFEIKNNNYQNAFEYSEMLRSRGFLDQIGLERALSLDGVTESERQQIKDFTSQIATARKDIEKLNSMAASERDSKKLSQAEKKLADAEKSLSKLDESISKRLPTYSQLRNPQTVKAKDAQKWCGKNRAVLEYVIYEPEDESQEKYAYCIVVTNKKITSVKLKSDYDYNSAIQSLRNAITHRPIKSEMTFEKQRNELYENLVKPVLPYIKGTKDLLIVPDGNLSFLPFDMLRENSDSDDFGKKFSIGFSPSISVSMIADNVKSSSNDILAFYGAWYDKSLSEEQHKQTLRGNGTRGIDRGGSSVVSQTNMTEDDLRKLIEEEGSGKYFEHKKLKWSDLPGTVIEVETLQKNVFKSAKTESQKMASESVVKELSKRGELSKYAVLHLACHGYFDSDLSEMSSVLFSEVSGKLEDISQDDGYLTIGEAASLNLSAQMVCLSACQTGLGKIQKGEGMIGLSRAFMVAGSKNVGATLWCVDDAATAEFMSRMYKKVKSGMSYSEAYRKVKNEFRNSEDYSHPYYWAAFVLYE